MVKRIVVLTPRYKDVDEGARESLKKAKKELKKQIEAVEENPSLVDSPISMAVDLKILKQSNNPESKTILDLTKMVSDINFIVRDIKTNI